MVQVVTFGKWKKQGNGNKEAEVLVSYRGKRIVYSTLYNIGSTEDESHTVRAAEKG